MTMYVRVKRLKTTLFLHVEPTETVLELKQKVQALTEQPAEEQRLVFEGVILDDAKTLAENKISNDSVLAVAYKIDEETNTWEEVNISVPGAPES